LLLLIYDSYCFLFSLYSLQFCTNYFLHWRNQYLETRVWQHRNNEGGAFTAKYKCYYLIYYEDYSDIRNAIAREKQLKNWKREWKIELIRKQNPDLIDLAKDWY